MEKAIRKLPSVEIRVETGVVQFGDDWPGIFIRGDDAFFSALNIRRMQIPVNELADLLEKAHAE